METKSTKAAERVADVLVAIDATLYIAFVAVVLVVIVLAASGCAATSISSRADDPCGDFSSTVVGVPPFYTPAGQYATYSGACATRRTVEVIAEQREAVVRASWAAASKVNAVDPKARKMAKAALRMSRTTADLVTSEEGGAK